MRVERVTMHNFGSFEGLHTVKLADRGLTFVLGTNLDEPKMESNGAGKSTCFDALDWALFGKVPKGDKSDSVVNERAGSKCWVIVELCDGSAVWWVYRYRKMPEGNGVKLYSIHPEDGTKAVNCTALDSKETDARIEQALGLDRDVFHAAVYRQQGDTFNFADATDGERKRMLTRIIPELAQCDQLHERAKAKRDEALDAYQGVQAQMAGVQNQLASFEQTDFGQMEQAWRASKSQRLEQARATLHAAHAAYAQAYGQYQQFQDLQEELNALVQPTPVTLWAEERDRRKNAYDILRSQADVAGAERKRLQDLVQKFETMGVGECFNCGQPVTAEHLVAEVQRVRAQLDQVQVPDTTQAHAAWKEAEGYAAQEAKANQAASTSYTQRHTALSTQLQGISQLNFQGLQQAIDQAQAGVASIEAEQWVVPDSSASIQGYQHQLASLQVDSDHKQAVAEHWEWWVEATSNKGIKSYILDSRVEAMTEAANGWVSALTGGTFWVRFETQTMTAAGKLNEQFNVRIFRHNPDGTVTERNYKSWSGGEKKRVALGIDQGLSQLVASRAARPWSTYIIDESFRQHMDAGGRDAVVELLQSLNRDSIFVVDHDPEMAALFEDQLLVQIKDRRSSFPNEDDPGDSEDPKIHLPDVVG